MNDVVRNALSDGYVLKDYRIESVLGHGGFGITYLATDINLNKPVALKEFLPGDLAMREGDSQVVPKSSSAEDDFNWGLEQFLIEAQMLARFEHPNITSVLRFFEANGTAYFAMAFHEGRSLDEVLDREGFLSEDQIRGLLMPLLDGLETVHKGGVLHRDIKTSNIFLRADGTPVLLDFGAARQSLSDKSAGLTVIVSRGYAPFEQYRRGGDQGPWSDIYALAAVLYEAITGAPPPESIERVLEDDPYIPAAETAKGRYSKTLLDSIDKALMPMAKDRPQSVAAWRKMLGKNPSGKKPKAVPIEPKSGGKPVASEPRPAEEGMTPVSALSAPRTGPSAGKSKRPKKSNKPASAPAAGPASARSARSGSRAAKSGAAPASSRGRVRRVPSTPGQQNMRTGLMVAGGAFMAIALGGLLWVLFGDMLTGDGGGNGGTEIASTGFGSTGAAPTGAPLTGKALTDLLAGATLHMRRPARPVTGNGEGDAEIILKIAKGGKLRAEAYTVTGNAADTARWSVSRDRLCIDWAKWADGKRHCYQVAPAGEVYAASGGAGVLAGSFALVK